MKKNEVKVGNVYRVKVSGQIAEVRITGENPHGGWDGVNVATNRKVRIKSIQRLRGLVKRPAKRKSIVSLAEYEADAKAATGKTVPSAEGAKKPAKATKDAEAATKRDTGERRRTSGLDAAAEVLAEAGGPLGCKEIVEQMLAKGLWKTNGKTPAATIYSAMTRESAAKGDASRFRKVARGKFELAK